MAISLTKSLLKLHELQIPHPRWEFVQSPEELKRYYNLRDYCGWTIRSLLEAKEHPDGKPFHVNWVYKPDVPRRIEEFRQSLDGKGWFVVYPSWKWNAGGTLLLDNKQLVIEAVKGAIYNLLKGVRRDVTLIHDRESKQTLFTKGEKELVPIEVKTKLFETADKLRDDNYILEWAITTENKLIFYNLELLKDAQKRLLDKYSKQ